MFTYIFLALILLFLIASFLALFDCANYLEDICDILAEWERED